MTRFKRPVGLMALLLLVCESSFAGIYNVSPIRLELKAGQRSSSVEVASTQQEPMMIRATLKRWTQVNGEDVYEPTSALAVVPPVFKLDGGSKQVLRVGFLGRPRPLERQEAYRLFLSEVADALPQEEAGEEVKEVKVMIRTTLNLDMPVYVLPKKRIDELRVGFQQALDQNGSGIVLSNPGTIHQKLMEPELVGSDGQVAKLGLPYVFLLPETVRRVALTGELAQLKPPYRLRYVKDLGRQEMMVSSSP